MATLDYKGKSYELDSNDFLQDFRSWDEDCAEGMAQRLGMRKDLTKEQWDVINFIRDTFKSVADMSKHLRNLQGMWPTS